MTPWLALLLPALAGDIYLNGILANGLRNQDFHDVDVHIDENGNVYISSESYQVQVLPTDAPAPQPAGVVPAGRYWLVTEDHGSVGHVIELRIDGVLVRTIRSGDPQLILDLAPYLHPGTNTVSFRALPAEHLDGGILHVYIGPGENVGGVVHLDHPPIDFTRRSSDDPAGTTATYSFQAAAQ